jgi:hypothetical protein
MSSLADLSVIFSAFRTRNNSALLQQTDPIANSFKVDFPNKENHHETPIIEDLLRNFTPDRSDVNDDFGRYSLATSDMSTWV